MSKSKALYQWNQTLPSAGSVAQAEHLEHSAKHGQRRTGAAQDIGGPMMQAARCGAGSSTRERQPVAMTPARVSQSHPEGRALVVPSLLGRSARDSPDATLQRSQLRSTGQARFDRLQRSKLRSTGACARQGCRDSTPFVRSEMPAPRRAELARLKRQGFARRDASAQQAALYGVVVRPAGRSRFDAAGHARPTRSTPSTKPERRQTGRHHKYRIPSSGA